MRPAEASLAAVAAIWVAAGAAGCGAEAPPEATGGAQVGCIYGGTPSPSQVALTAGEMGALAELAIAAGGDGDAFGASCSGLLVADRWVLTAAHCTRDPASTRVTARFGPAAPCGQPGRRAIASTAIVTHPSLDLMLVGLAEAPAEVGIAAAPLRPDADEDLRPGAPVELAGFGWTDDSSPGRLRFAVEAVSAMGDDWIEVDGRGQSGACVADSGGPLLVRDAAGAARTVGVLSAGSASCRGTDRYVRLRAALDWVAAVTLR